MESKLITLVFYNSLFEKLQKHELFLLLFTTFMTRFVNELQELFIRKTGSYEEHIQTSNFLFPNGVCCNWSISVLLELNLPSEEKKMLNFTMFAGWLLMMIPWWFRCDYKCALSFSNFIVFKFVVFWCKTCGFEIFFFFENC